MLKFFRNIRKQLVGTNNFNKYLIYAIGEIFLVVIGILIALWINNLNTIKQQKQVEQIYLSSLEEEFKQNYDLLDATIKNNEQLIVHLENLSMLFDENIYDTITETSVNKYLFNAISPTVEFNPSMGVLTEIISSGNLKNIENFELRQQLASYGNSIEKLKQHQADGAKFYDKAVEHYLKKGNLKKTMRTMGREVKGLSKFDSINNKSLFNSMEFENHIYLYTRISKTKNLFAYLPLKSDIEKILQLIKSELKRH